MRNTRRPGAIIFVDGMDVTAAFRCDLSADFTQPFQSIIVLLVHNGLLKNPVQCSNEESPFMPREWARPPQVFSRASPLADSCPPAISRQGFASLPARQK